MKLSADQQILVFQQKLTFTVKYIETYNEVYDHVLLALADDKGPNSPDEIIEQEFGGYEELNTMEKYRAGLIVNAMRRKHWQNVRSFFNWPAVVFTTLIVLAGSWIQIHNNSHTYLMDFTMALSIMPLLFIGYKKLAGKCRAWRSGIYKKRSIKDKYIFTAALFSCNVVNFTSFAVRHGDSYGIITVVGFVFYTIYVLGFFRLYREEYKMNMAV